MTTMTMVCTNRKCGTSFKGHPGEMCPLCGSVAFMQMELFRPKE